MFIFPLPLTRMIFRDPMPDPYMLKKKCMVTLHDDTVYVVLCVAKIFGLINIALSPFELCAEACVNM